MEGNTKFCASCNRANRKAEEQPREKKASYIRSQSQKRASENQQYSREGKTFLKRNNICGTGCGNPSEQIHHQKGRIASLLLDKRFWLAVCADCHTKIENNPEWAIEKGYSIKRTII